MHEEDLKVWLRRDGRSGRIEGEEGTLEEVLVEPWIVERVIRQPRPLPCGGVGDGPKEGEELATAPKRGRRPLQWPMMSR